MELRKRHRAKNSMRSSSRRSSVAAKPAILAVVAITAGCASITANTRWVDRPIQTYQATETTLTWQFRAEAVSMSAPTESDAEVPATLRFTRFHPCKLVDHAVVDRTLVAERHWDETKDNGRYSIYFWSGLAFAASVVGGAYLYGNANSTDEKAGGIAIMAGGGAASLSIPLANEIRASNYSTHIGRVDEAGNTRTTECDIEPAAKTRVALISSSGLALAEGRTNEEGQASFSVKGADILLAGPTVTILQDGQSVGTTEAMRPLYEVLAREQREARKATVQRDLIADAEKEITTGRCSDEHASRFQEIVASMMQSFFDPMTKSASSSDIFELEGSQLIVASAKPAKVTLRTVVGGEIHIFVLSYDKGMQIEVLDPQRYPITKESVYLGLMAQTYGYATQTRQLHAVGGQAIDIGIRGRGCAVVAAVRRY